MNNWVPRIIFISISKTFQWFLRSFELPDIVSFNNQNEILFEDLFKGLEWICMYPDSKLRWKLSCPLKSYRETAKLWNINRYNKHAIQITFQCKQYPDFCHVYETPILFQTRERKNEIPSLFKFSRLCGNPDYFK